MQGIYNTGAERDGSQSPSYGMLPNAASHLDTIAFPFCKRLGETEASQLRPHSSVGLRARTHLQVDDANPLVWQMGRVGAGAHGKVHSVGLKLALEEGERGNRSALANEERLDSPLSFDARCERCEVGRVNVA